MSSVIDTGSSDCLIKASIVLSKGFKFSKLSSTLIGFGGCETSSSGVIYENVQIDDCEIEQIRFRVVSDNVLDSDVLIGRNFTERPEIV